MNHCEPAKFHDIIPNDPRVAPAHEVYDIIPIQMICKSHEPVKFRDIIPNESHQPVKFHDIIGFLVEWALGIILA